MTEQSHDMDQVSRSITINGRRTSIRMERSVWQSLSEIAENEETRLRDLIAMIDDIRGDNGLTASLRVFIINYYRAHSIMQPVSATGGKKAGSPRIEAVLATLH